MPDFVVTVTTEWQVEVGAEDKDEAIEKVASFMEPGPDNITYEFYEAEELEEEDD